MVCHPVRAIKLINQENSQKKQKPEFFKVNQKIKKTIENTGVPRIFRNIDCLFDFWLTLTNSVFILNFEY